MKSLWNAEEAAALGDDLVALRTLTSQLMGRDPALVLHGGGNTSVKVRTRDFFGEPVEILYVKGSGWDLKTIAPEGFSPVRQDTLLQMANLETLTDSDMVRVQRAAMLNPDAPAPSVEAILHAVIPFTFVDHSHADAIVTITNTPGGADRIAEIYGNRVIIVPYVMPGFKLARAVADQIQDINWAGVEGMILLNHGAFTFGETAQLSYERMIRLVDDAERYLKSEEAWDVSSRAQPAVPQNPRAIATLRQAVSEAMGAPALALLNSTEQALDFANRANISDIANRGPVTPDHIIRTKRLPLFVGDDPAADVASYVSDYLNYFKRQEKGQQTCLDPAPRWAIWPGHGVLSFGRTLKEARIVEDIIRHTMTCILRAEALGGWRALGEADLFEMEYWELEQAKLKRGKTRPPMAGRVALVTGAASGIGEATARHLAAMGAAVIAVDLDDSVVERFDSVPTVTPLVADLTHTAAVNQVVAQAVTLFGGLDLLVSNAGTFPPGRPLSELDDDLWSKTLEVNLTSHQKVLRAASPLLAAGLEPAVVIVGSKNVPAPGAGVAAYSSAKAGLTQLARVAAFELGSKGVRVNVVHPNAVFDTGIWDDSKIAARADSYGLSADAYRKRNVLGVEITSADVARMIVTALGPAFRCTTGAQLPIDGGNDRVI